MDFSTASGPNVLERAPTRFDDDDDEILRNTVFQFYTEFSRTKCL